MTLAVILAPLLALCVVARGMGFLPALGVVTAVAMLVDAQGPLQEFGAACAVLLSVLPVWFVSRYQDDGARERTGPVVPFLALGLMVILQLTTGTPAAMGEAAPGHAGAAYLPAGLCVALAGLVAVTCRQAMVWQWAGLLVCVDGVMLSGVIENQVMVVGVTALAGCVVALLGGMCVHRVMLRVAVAPAQSGTGADRPSARASGFEIGDVDAPGPEPRGLGPEAVVAPRIWTEAEAAAEEEDSLPRPAQADRKAASPHAIKESHAAPPATARPQSVQESVPESISKSSAVLDAEAAFSGTDAATEEAQDGEHTQSIRSEPHAEPAERDAPEADLLKAASIGNEADEPKGATEPDRPVADQSEKAAGAASSDTVPEPEAGSEQPESGEPSPVPRTPEMIARDVWLRGYLTERGRDA